MARSRFAWLCATLSRISERSFASPSVQSALATSTKVSAAMRVRDVVQFRAIRHRGAAWPDGPRVVDEAVGEVVPDPLRLELHRVAVPGDIPVLGSVLGAVPPAAQVRANDADPQVVEAPARPAGQPGLVVGLSHFCLVVRLSDVCLVAHVAHVLLQGSWRRLLLPRDVKAERSAHSAALPVTPVPEHSRNLQPQLLSLRVRTVIRARARGVTLPQGPPDRRHARGAGIQALGAHDAHGDLPIRPLVVAAAALLPVRRGLRGLAAGDREGVQKVPSGREHESGLHMDGLDHPIGLLRGEAGARELSVRRIRLRNVCKPRYCSVPQLALSIRDKNKPLRPREALGQLLGRDIRCRPAG
eukprot:scaffold565_cov379-Pinguiococcus_pyrenoidosus.AAC.7